MTLTFSRCWAASLMMVWTSEIEDGVLNLSSGTRNLISSFQLERIGMVADCGSRGVLEAERL